MANYWLNYNDGTTSEIFHSLTLFSHVRNSNAGATVTIFNAQGDDVDVDRLFRLINAKIIVKDCTIENLTLTSDPGAQMPEREFELINCKINILKIDGLRFNYFFIKSCTFDEFIYENGHIRNSLQISERTSILKNFEIKSKVTEVGASEPVLKELIVSNSTIKVNFSNLNFRNFDLTNNTDCTFLLKSCSFDNFIVKNSKREIIYVSDSNFQALKFNKSQESKFVVEKCNLSYELNLDGSENSDFLFTNLNYTETLTFNINNNHETNVTISDSYFNNEISFKGNASNKNNILLLKNVIFKDLVIFNHKISLILQIENTLFQKGIFVPINPKYLLLDEIAKVHSSVWCTLKNQALARNDAISAMELKKHEMESYSQELKSVPRKYQEKIVLFLNKWSNNHGISWWRGFVFTFFSWIFFFSIYYTISKEGFGIRNVEIALFKKIYWEEAFKFLWIPLGIDLLTNYIKQASNFLGPLLSSIFFIFGKIFIGYGIYQTISAFRKHGKL